MRRRLLSSTLQAVVCLAVIATAACGGSSTPKPVTLTPAVHFSIPNATYGMPSAVVDQPYTYGFQTNIGQSGIAGKPPVTYVGQNLPPGMALSSTGVLSGTPTQVGNFVMTIYAIDSSPVPLAISKEFPLLVRLPGATLTQVAHTSLDGHGQNGPVTVATASATQTSYAYVGTRGSVGDCPASGVKIVDLSQITNPQLVATAGGVAGAAQARAAVLTGVTTSAFHTGRTGDLLAVTEQPCDPHLATAAQEGVRFFDVTDPNHPLPLGAWTSGLNGASDVALLANGSNLYALVAVPGSETGPRDSSEGDLRVLDVTDPANPREVGNWGLAHATGVPLTNMGMGQDQRVFLDTIHLSKNHQTAYLAYWDGGVVVLDVSHPLAIASNNGGIFLNHLTYATTTAATTDSPSVPEGNTHAVLPVKDGAGLLVSDDVCASGSPLNPALAVVCGPDNSTALSSDFGWGYLRSYALDGPGSASIAGFFVTAGSVSAPAPDNGIYTAYDLAWNSDSDHPHAYVAWYSSGVADVDISNLNAPALLASFVPPDTADPNGNGPQDNPKKSLVDGVAAYATGGKEYVLASDMNSGLWVLQDTPAGGLSIVTRQLPDGNVLVPYRASVSAVNGTLGNSAVIFSLAPNSNPLPPGLTLGTGGNLLGTPLVSGTYTLNILARDASGETAQQTVTLTITQNLAIVAPTPPLATLREPYTLKLSAVNGVSPYTWSLLGTPPNGLTLDSSSGVLSGTPESLGASTVNVQVTDSSTPALTATLPVTIDVAALKVYSDTLPDGAVGVGYGATVFMANGAGPFTPVVISGTLPPGVSVSAGSDPNSGWVVTGTPTTAGVYNFSVLITDADGQSTTQPFTIVVNPFEVNPAVQPAGVEGHGYDQQLTVQGGTGPYQFSLVTGSLPPGLLLSSAGVISGVPASASAGTYDFGLHIQDSNGVVANQTVELVIFSGNSLAITTTGLLPAQVGQTFSQTLSADFGAPPYRFRLFAGVLPAGISFDSGGTLAGVPGSNSAGSYSITFQVTDANGATATRHFLWTVLPALSTH